MFPADVQRWLQQHCESSSQVHGGIVVVPGEKPDLPRIVAEWPVAGHLTAELTAAAQVALQRGRMVVAAPGASQLDSGHNRVLALPVRAGECVVGAAALAIRADDSAAVEKLFKALSQASEEVGCGLGCQGNGPMASPGVDLTHALQLQATLLDHSSLAEAALAMVSDLAAMVGCVRVTLGVVEGREIELIAVSNSAEFKAQQELLRLVAAGMHEAVDQGVVVTYPAEPEGPPRIVLAHAELHARTGHTLVTVPLVHGGRAVGALLAERSGDAPFDAGQMALLESLACLTGPLVQLRRRVEQPWRARMVEALRAGYDRVTRRDDPMPKAVVAGILVLLLAGTLVPVRYRVAAPARVEGAVQRVVAAPVDGFLHKSHVRPGDTVRTGDLLVELSDQDLLLERRKWESALTQHENGVAAALARSDRAQFSIRQSKASEALAQLELVRQQLARTRLVAPIDGVVIKGDPNQTLGAPVQRGDALLTLAPAHQFRLILEVDERDVAAVVPGQTGQLALSAMPADTLAFMVERVTPVATVLDGRNAFEVEARLNAGEAAALRPGLRGVAKIDAGQRSLAWISGHRALDWLRMAVWSWGY